MANSVMFFYENQLGGQLVFGRTSDHILSEISGMSQVSATVAETQGVGQVGATAAGASIQPKTITVNGTVRTAAGRAALLAAVLPGVPAALAMVDGAKKYIIEGIPEKSPEVSSNDGPQSFQFALRCSYPYWHGPSARSLLSGLSARFHFPTSLAGHWYISRYTSEAFCTVTNPGNIASDLTLQFRARTQVTNPRVYHLESESYIQLNTTLNIGDTITVSTVYGSKGATHSSQTGSETNAFRLLDIGSNLAMQLQPGVNTFRVTASAGADGLDVTLIAPKGVWAGV